MIILFLCVINDGKVIVMKIKSFIQKNEKVIGNMGAIIGSLMFLSLIEVFLSNFRGNSDIFWQPTFTAINGALWAMCGISKRDPRLILPNSLGFILGIVTALSALF